MRKNDHEKTKDFTGTEYSPEIIRKLEDPEYAKEADKYEYQALRHQNIESSKDSSSRFNDKKKKNCKWNKKKVIRNAIIIIALIMVALIGIFFYLTSHLDKFDTSNSDFGINSQVASDLSGYRNIAILGSDARSNEGLDGSRTDAIIIMSIKKSTGAVKLISVMRDSYLKLPYFDDELILDKITHAHHFTDGVGTCSALNRNLDLNIEEFVVFDWKAVSDIVDALDGIKVDVKENEIADLNKWGPETGENVGKDYKKITSTGEQTIDGVQATTYCRIRKTSGGDSGRAQRYKKVISAVMKKTATSPLALGKLTSIMPQIRTNISQPKLLTLGLGFPFYNFQESYGFPQKYYSGLLPNQISYVVPTTLKSNVVDLHETVFGQSGYTVSDTCENISIEIINDTGLQ